MARLSIADSAWTTSFPHLVVPQENEWIVGVLLRCDEANFWSSGTTFSFLLSSHHRKNVMARIALITEIHLEKLAHALALPMTSIIATTYQQELVRIYGKVGPEITFSRSPLSFHLCPICVKTSRYLARTSILPGINHCPQHRIHLVSTCQCGVPLVPFHTNTIPFICYKCGVNWADLPSIDIPPQSIEAEQKLLSAYNFFLTKGSPKFLRQTQQLVSNSCLNTEKMLQPLELLIRGLLENGISPDTLISVSEQGS